MGKKQGSLVATEERGHSAVHQEPLLIRVAVEGDSRR